MLDVTDEQRSSRPIFNATLRAAAGWLFFRVTRSTRMTRIWALRSRLEKQPTDLRRHHHYMRDGTPWEFLAKNEAIGKPRYEQPRKDYETPRINNYFINRRSVGFARSGSGSGRKDRPDRREGRDQNGADD